MRYSLPVAVSTIVFGLFVAVDSQAATVCSSGADFTSGSAGLNALEPGGELLFCAGESHAVGGTYRLGDLEGAYVGAYGTGEIPTLTGGLNFGGAATVGITFDGLRFRGNGSDHGLRLGDGTSDFTVMNSIIENYSVGMYVKKETGAHAQRNITLINSVIQNNHSQGFLGGGPGLYIGHNIFIDNGHNGVYDHNIYVGCSTDTPDGEPCPQIIEFNQLQGASKDDYGRCQGTEIVAHGYANGLIIRNNIIREPEGRVSTCYGISVAPGYPTKEWMANVTITGNEIYGAGRVAINVEETDGVYVADNVIVNSDAEFSLIGVQIKGGEEVSVGGNPATNVLIEDNYISLSRTGTRFVPVYIWDTAQAPITVRNNDVVLDGVPGEGVTIRPPSPPAVVPGPSPGDGSQPANPTDPGSSRPIDSTVSPGVGPQWPQADESTPTPVRPAEEELTDMSFAQVLVTGAADSRGRIKLKGLVSPGEGVSANVSGVACRTNRQGSFRCMGRYLAPGTQVTIALD